MHDIDVRILHIIREFIGEMDNPRRGMSDQQIRDASFADIGFDSLETLELVIRVEDEFSIEVEEADALACETVGQFIELARRAPADRAARR